MEVASVQIGTGTDLASVSCHYSSVEVCFFVTPNGRYQPVLTAIFGLFHEILELEAVAYSHRIEFQKYITYPIY